MRRRLLAGLCFAAGLGLVVSLSAAQPPDGGGKGGKGGFGKKDKGGFKGDKGGPGGGGGDPTGRMMTAFDANKDGKLSKDEVTDDRLKKLFDRADADKDGVVTKDELSALFAKGQPAGGGGGPGGAGGFPGGFGPPGGGPGGFPGGPGGPGGFGGPPRPGQVLPDFLQGMLQLNDEQKKQVEALQKDVDTKLDKILTADQKKQLAEMRQRGPGGFGPPGGFPGGPPPGGPGGPPDKD